jgi:nicotinamide-nucleotide amidase
MENPAWEIGKMLREKGLTLGCVESATGGLISKLITDIPGSSDYYKGSITSYSNEVKVKLVGVSHETLERFGAVSPQVAEEMAIGGRKALDVDICLSDTGIAGPGGETEGKPAGLFYIGLSHKDGTYSRKLLLSGNREQNRKAAAEAVLLWLKEYLSGLQVAKDLNKNPVEKHVVTCFLENDGEILILKRSQKVGTNKGMWAGVSGYVETVCDRQALIEIGEETGLFSDDIELIKSGHTLEITDIDVKWVVHPYLFHIKDREKVRIDWEHTEFKWIKPQELDKYNTVSMLKEVLSSVYQLR